jgi:hypothetical protein
MPSPDLDDLLLKLTHEYEELVDALELHSDLIVQAADAVQARGPRCTW